MGAPGKFYARVSISPKKYLRPGNIFWHIDNDSHNELTINFPGGSLRDVLVHSGPIVITSKDSLLPSLDVVVDLRHHEARVIREMYEFRTWPLRMRG